MRKLLIVLLSCFAVFFMFDKTVFAAPEAIDCREMATHNILGLPVWYKYIFEAGFFEAVDTDDDDVADTCNVVAPTGLLSTDNNVIWLIVAAVLEILIRLAGFVSVIFIFFGGFKILTSGGNPDGVSQGRKNIISALVGLVIAVMATSIVSYLANKLAAGTTGNTDQGLPMVDTSTVLDTILGLVYRLAAGITVILVVISGINFATASGDPQQLSKARNGIIYALIGLVVTLLAVTIAAFVGGKL